MERKKETSSVGMVVARRKKAEMKPGKERKIAGEEEGKSPGKEEEGKGSRALHVASPKIGKIPILIPEVFMTSNYFYKNFQSQNNPHTNN